jgi:ABC-2 type transport system permease protein
VNAPSVVALLRAETIKLLSTRTALGLFIAAVALSVVPAALAMALLPKSALEESGAYAGAAFGLTVVPMLAVVFGVLGMTNEYRHGTITYTYLDTPRRWMVIVAKLVCYGVVGAAVMALTGVLVALTIVAVAAMRGVPLTAGQGTSADHLLTVGNVTLFIATVGLMTAFGVGLGALLRAQVPTVAGTLVWALAIEPIIAAVKPSVGKFLPFTAFEQLNFGGQSAGVEGTVMGLTQPEAFMVSFAYIAVVSVAAVYISMRRDVT